jgi:hypothetical protein
MGLYSGATATPPSEYGIIYFAQTVFLSEPMPSMIEGLVIFKGVGS